MNILGLLVMISRGSSLLEAVVAYGGLTIQCGA